MTKEKNNEGVREVIDRHGTAYQFKGKLSEGGQGIVCLTQFPNVLVKIGRHLADDPRNVEWYKHLEWVGRQDLTGLRIARPQSMLADPPRGYVMELMDGLEPLQTAFEASLAAAAAGEGLGGFLQSGGLSRRFRLLSSLARSLAELHGRGLAYGDLAPGNVFVSKTHANSEVWLIDCDNISVVSRGGGQKVYTPDYGAPEIMRGECGINSLTDSWSFAVIAFQILTLQHPLKGDYVIDGVPELEEQALRGEIPWIDHPDDDSNRASHGLPREWVTTKNLRALFERCFNAGLNESGERPSMAEWSAEFEAANAVLLQCAGGDGCGSGFVYNRQRKCPFCDRVLAEDGQVLLSHYLYVPADELGEGAQATDQWIATDHHQVLTNGAVEFRASPVGSITYSDSEVLCTVDYLTDGLWIAPIGSRPIALQRNANGRIEGISRRMRLKNESRRGEIFVLHIGDLAQTHDAWRFKW